MKNYTKKTTPCNLFYSRFCWLHFLSSHGTQSFPHTCGFHFHQPNPTTIIPPHLQVVWTALIRKCETLTKILTILILTPRTISVGQKKKTLENYSPETIRDNHPAGYQSTLRSTWSWPIFGLKTWRRKLLWKGLTKLLYTISKCHYQPLPSLQIQYYYDNQFLGSLED